MIAFNIVKKLARQWTLESNHPDLLKAQYRAFSQKIPMMYIILLVNTWALSWTHLKSAPAWLVIYCPLGLTLFCLWRFVVWIHGRHQQPDALFAYAALQRTNWLTVPIATGFSIWAIMLYPYGDAYARSHVAFYMGVTVISCIFCLMYLRQAAITVALIVNTIFASFFVATGEPTYIAAAVNVALVTIAMLAIVTTHYTEFKKLIESQVQMRSLNEENQRLANLDYLTNIPNRRKFFLTLEKCCQQAKSENKHFSLVVIDLDGFKAINDLYGHAQGDKLLAAVGKRISSFGNERILAFRLGGDEFAVIIMDCVEREELHRLCERICNSLRLPFGFVNNSMHVAASAGVATFPEMAKDSWSLYENADYALFHAKRNNKGTVSFFSVSDQVQIQRAATIEQALRQCDYEREIFVVFQPVVNIADGTTVAFEGLARWNSAIVGPISPDVFIPAAERMGIIGQLSQVVLRKALSTARQWPETVRLSFNLSAEDLNAQGGIANLVRIIEEEGISPSRLDLEITETAMLYDLDTARKSIQSLRELGCGVTLDDFGTGFSSLSLLHALPLSRIKIDKRFVSDIQLNLASHKIVKSLLALSRDMGLDCVVEGVETELERETLLDLGAIWGQGYLFSRPLTAQQTGDWLGGGHLMAAKT